MPTISIGHWRPRRRAGQKARWFIRSRAIALIPEAFEDVRSGQKIVRVRRWQTCPLENPRNSICTAYAQAVDAMVRSSAQPSRLRS